MAGTTIDGLNSVTSLTSQDEVPVWDAEASGEPTKKITAQNFASSVKTLADLQGALTFDTTPTINSTNPVTSGGIATAISQSTATVSGSATAASGITLSTFSVRKAGNVVIIHGVATITGSIAGNLAVVFTLPDGYKPVDEIYFSLLATYNGTVQPATFAINPSGQFRTRTGGGTFTGVIYVDCIYAV